MINISEKKLTPNEIDKKEEIIKAFKAKKSEFVKKYGKDKAMGVMYAIATKTAERVAEDVQSNTLYVSRPVINANDIIDWANKNEVTTVPAKDMHITIVYSKSPVNTSKIKQSEPKLTIIGGNRELDKFGDNIVLKISSDSLQSRWKEYINAGATWDYANYIPHITLTTDASGINYKKIKPYNGPIYLGDEISEPLNMEYEFSKVLTKPKKTPKMLQREHLEATGELLSLDAIQERIDLPQGWKRTPDPISKDSENSRGHIKNQMGNKAETSQIVKAILFNKKG